MQESTRLKRQRINKRIKAKFLSQIFTAIIMIVIYFDIYQDSKNQSHSNQFKSYLYHLGVLAFNLDPESALVYKGPENSYFGYTVAQHKDRGSNWLLVGAPRAQTNQPKTPKAGAVYKCAPSHSEACQQFVFDPNGSSVIDILGKKVETDSKAHQFFGASLQSASESGSIVACASSYTYYSPSLRRRDPVGTCWISRGSFSGLLEYSPCRIDQQWGHHKMGSCQAGFSSAITKDGSRLFMGAPGSHVWQGQVFAHNLKTDLTNSTSAVNPPSEDDSLLGYSLSVGKFSASTSSSRFSSDADLAIGVPRGNELAGQVRIVDREMRSLRNISGEQIGSYFGHSMATADLNGDGLDDLVIGAPMFFNKTLSLREPHFERGRIYVVLQNNRHEFNIVQKLDGRKNKARFGSSIANCGDLNRDGFQDIAVGAPHDGPDNHGAVYIYMGRKWGLNEDYDQVIYAHDINLEAPNLRSFGFSLSGGLDVDGNHYPDLLVGDYEASRAILLKTRPIVNVEASISFNPDNFNLGDRHCLLTKTSTSVSCTTVRYCIKFTGFNVDDQLTFDFDIKLDTENKGAPRLFFLDRQSKNSTSLSKGVNLCRSFKAYISRQIKDKLTPLTIEIDYDLANEPYDNSTSLIKLKPVLNKLKPNKLIKSALIQKNCGSDNICVPDLRLTISPNLEQYIIGSNEKLILDVTVKNYGEDAFESKFYLIMPMTINYKTLDKTNSDYPVCFLTKQDRTDNNILTCDLGNPQTPNSVVKFSIITEPSQSVSTSPDFTFIANVNSTNPEPDDRHRENNQVAIGIPIKVETDLVLSGNSYPQLVVHNSTSAPSKLARPKASEADLGPEVYHVYQLKNRGPSQINEIAVSILWPTMTKEGKYLLYLVDEPLTNNKVRCKPVSDAINPLSMKYLRGDSIDIMSNNDPVNSASIVINSDAKTIRSKRQAYRQLPTTDQSFNSLAINTVDNSILKQLNLFNCELSQCTRFDCIVYNLSRDEIATIKIRSRFYEETLNYLTQQKFDIVSKLVAQVKSLPYNSMQTMPPFEYRVETRIHTMKIPLQDLINWWVIALASLLGGTLFILLVRFLKHLGFFDAKRPPPQAEREPLTPTIWNEYHYSPGDTAL